MNGAWTPTCLALLGTMALACGAPDPADELEAPAAHEVGVSYASGTVFDTGGAGLYVRAAPNTSSAKLALLGEGQSVGISCQTTGQSIDGVTVWNKLSAYNGYVSDRYLWTGHEGFIPGVPKCGGGGSGGSGGGSPDIPAGTTCEYGFFEEGFTAINGSMPITRKAAFTRIADKVATMQQKGSGVTLGGMLSLLEFEGAFGVAWYNDLCAENVYGCGSSQAPYGYQLGFAPVHLSNYHPCASTWNSDRRDYLLQRFTEEGFQPSAAQVQSVAGDLHAFCSASVQPTAVEYYILRAHQLGLPWDSKGNDTDGFGTFPFYTPSIMIDSFFDVITHMGSGCAAPSSDSALIGTCFGGGNGWYTTWDAQQMILASWKSYQAAHCP